MILPIIILSVVMGVLIALASWLAEHALAGLGRARRGAWVVGILAALVLPLIATLRPTSSADQMAATISHGSSHPESGTADIPLAMIHFVQRFDDARTDDIAVTGWAALSLSGLLCFGASAWRLSARARSWPQARIGRQVVIVAPDIGPAVFGWRRPQVIFPAWLVSAPDRFRRLALAHEAQHLAARDPHLLAAATVLLVLFPWNLPLLWMVRRLRFAMEVDCDARVIGAGADASDYGLALLYVSERQAMSPPAALALIERTSQLERRIDIMFSTPRRFRRWAAGLCLSLAGTCIVAAGSLDSPDRPGSAAMLKPPPGVEDSVLRLGQLFERHIHEKYSELIGGSFEGTPMIVAILNDTSSIARSVKTMNLDSSGDVNVTSDVFNALGLSPAETPYVGAMHMQMARGKLVVVVYTEHQTPGRRFVSRVFPDTRKQDRQLYEEQFPVGDPIEAGRNPWVLLDRAGNVVRKGIDVTTPQWHTALEQRFPGIDAQEVTVTPLTRESGEPLHDAVGREVQLVSVWLAPDSGAP